jgi:hypothetical protein
MSTEEQQLMINSKKISLIQLLSIALSPFVFISCESLNSPQNVPSSQATLSEIRIVERPNNALETDDYFIAELEPVFHPDSLHYTITVDTAFIFGVQPVSTDSKAGITVSLDGETISTKEWTDSEEFFTCNYKSAAPERIIEISVTAEDGTSRLSYTINVRYTYDSLQQPPDTLVVPLSDASLSEILTMVQPYGSEETSIADLQPDFDPEILLYSIRIATGNQLGIRPVTASAESGISVVTTWESQVTPEKHDGTDDFYYWVNKQSGVDYTVIEISVIAGDKKTLSVYKITASYYTDTLNEPPSDCATLADILTVVRNENGARKSSLPIIPVFRPDSLSYSVEIDSAWILGLQPVPSAPKASTIILLDGVAINPEVWPDSSKYFTCTPPPETNTRKIEITVTAEDKVTQLTYQINVKRRKPYTSNPCYLDDMPMAKWISDTMIICGSRCGYVRYFGFEEVQPSPKFASDSYEYLVHTGDFNFFGFAPRYLGYTVWCSVQSTTEIFRRLYDRYYYIKRPDGSKETDTITIVTSDSCEVPSVYTIIVAP